MCIRDRIHTQLLGDGLGGRKGGEHAVAVLVAQGDGLLLLGQGVAAADDKQVAALGLPALHRLVHAVKLQGGPHAVDGGAAAGAVHGAGEGGIDEHRPWGILSLIHI